MDSNTKPQEEAPIKKREKKTRAKKEITLSGKERSKIHRERKKQYYKDLEERVKFLELENQRLKARISELEISSVSDAPAASADKLGREEDFLYNVLPKMIKDKPNQFRMSLYESSRELEGAYGTERIKVLKSAFNKIIDGGIPQTFKVLLGAFNFIPLSCFKTLLLDKCHNNRSLYKFYRATEEKSKIKDYLGTTKGKYMFTIPDDKDWKLKRQRIEEYFYKYPFSESVIESWSRVGYKTKDYLFMIKKNVQDLVKIRNKMLKNLKELHNNYIESEMYKSFEKDDVFALSQLGSDLKGSDLIDPFSLWQVSSNCKF